MNSETRKLLVVVSTILAAAVIGRFSLKRTIETLSENIKLNFSDFDETKFKKDVFHFNPDDLKELN